MKRVPVSIPPLALTTSAQTAYLAPAGTTTTVANLSVTNTNATPTSVTLYNVPSGGTGSVANEFLAAFMLSAGQTYVPPAAIGLTLAPGSTLQALASATGVTLMGGAYETSGS
jgi:hypothetical protein